MATKKIVKTIKKAPAKKVSSKKVVAKKKLVAKKVVVKKGAATKPKSNTTKTIAKNLTKKAIASKAAEKKIDYFKLPFEVYYGDYVPVTSAELLSDIEVRKFSDLKVMHEEQGACFGFDVGRCG
jgi:seryl-tRNA synthetase